MSDQPMLTLQDIADLTGVQRPVVSMWRKRITIRGGERVPFPEPQRIADGMEWFGRDAVVEWLEHTGRGNNGEAHLDAPALSVPSGAVHEDLVTLLCLQACSGVELAGTTAQDLRAMARDVDPEDRYLLREVCDTDASEEALRYIDDLVESAYGHADALARLDSGQVGRARGIRDLTAEAVDLVRTIATAAARHLDPDGVPLIHAGSATSLTMALANDFTQLVVPEQDAKSRDLRRRAVICDHEVAASAGGRTVRMLSIAGYDNDDALDALDNVVIDLAVGDIVVVIGSAPILCDKLTGELEKKRALTMRSGSLVLALRLPRGMWRDAHRQSLGVWVCVGGAETQRPFVADLAAFTADELVPSDLGADVAGALEPGTARAFHYLRPHALSSVLSSKMALVPRGIRAPQLSTAAPQDHLTRIHEQTMVTADPLQGFDLLVEQAPGSMVLRKRSLGELSDEGDVKVKRGNRIDVQHADRDGTVAVLSATGNTHDVKLDPIDAEEHYPRAVRTEPGDVVIAEKPHPSALVDALGNSLVASPSKILRLSSTAGIGPHAVAAIINQQPPEANEWQAWAIPLLDPADAEQLEKALTAAAEHEHKVRRRLEAMLAMQNALIDGVAAGAVTLAGQPETVQAGA